MKTLIIILMLILSSCQMYQPDPRSVAQVVLQDTYDVVQYIYVADNGTRYVYIVRLIDGKIVLIYVSKTKPYRIIKSLLLKNYETIY